MRVKELKIHPDQVWRSMRKCKNPVSGDEAHMGVKGGYYKSSAANGGVKNCGVVKVRA